MFHHPARSAPVQPGVLVVAGILALPTAASALTFAPARHFSTGISFNHTVAVGDLNGDTKLDVAIPNSQNSTVTVLLGNGDGTLAAFQSFATGSEPQDVVMAELTGDSFLDLATPDYSGNGVSVLAGLGDGTFAPRVHCAAGAGLVSLAAVDLDGDGRLDLVASKESNHSIAVLPALAGGTFGTAIDVETGSTPHQIAAADLDHDDAPDVVVASNGAGVVSVHAGDGTFTPGAPTPYGAGASPVGLTLTDLDGDGDLDAVVSNVNAATISVLLGNGDGTLAAPVAYAADARPRGMDAGDLDGDEIPDVVVATGYPDAAGVLTIYRGVGDGSLERLAHIALPYRAADLVIADMNADGRRDIVVTGPQAGVVSVLLNTESSVAGVPPASMFGALELSIHPNPVRNSATFLFRAPTGVARRLEIYDSAGRRVASLRGEAASGGWQTAAWHGDTDDGKRGAPAVYFARLTAGPHKLARRLVLLPR